VFFFYPRVKKVNKISCVHPSIQARLMRPNEEGHLDHEGPGEAVPPFQWISWTGIEKSASHLRSLASRDLKFSQVTCK
jgi:hypothetical protein